MKIHLFAALSIATALSAQHALADDRAACLQAASQGETFRDAHRLIEARDQFRICAQQRCPAVVQKDCASWLDAAERGISTVVLSAKDDHGVDLGDVTVTVDGQP